MPKSRLDFWEPKLGANAGRDQRNKEQLQKAGWRVVTIWECETREHHPLLAKVDEVSELVGK
jgi:DNA mismatch endonuclease (patch repair protein)